MEFLCILMLAVGTAAAFNGVILVVLGRMQTAEAEIGARVGVWLVVAGLLLIAVVAILTIGPTSAIRTSWSVAQLATLLLIDCARWMERRLLRPSWRCRRRPRARLRGQRGRRSRPR